MFYEQKEKDTDRLVEKKITALLRNYFEGFVERRNFFLPLLMHFFDNL